MPGGRKPWSAARRALEHPEHPDSVAAWINRYLAEVRTRNVSVETWVRLRDDLVRFNTWCVERGIESPRELTLPLLERFRRFLFAYRKRNGQPLLAQSQNRELGRLRQWCRWLVKQAVLPTNPAAELDLPRAPRRLLPQVLTIEEVETILAQPDTTTLLGLRDRSMLEVLYSTGIRRRELTALHVLDVAFGNRTVFIRQGKGRKDRVVPIGERALAWVQAYLNEVRPHFVSEADEATLFLSRAGRRLGLDYLSQLARRCRRQAGITKPGACHLFRHAAATFMLENGADIRYIQEMLGHERLDTTQIYTRVSIGKLKEIHAATHPAARLARRPETSIADSNDSAMIEPESDK